jgi:hypothetical protein
MQLPLSELPPPFLEGPPPPSGGEPEPCPPTALPPTFFGLEFEGLLLAAIFPPLLVLPAEGFKFASPNDSLNQNKTSNCLFRLKTCILSILPWSISLQDNFVKFNIILK